MMNRAIWTRNPKERISRSEGLIVAAGARAVGSQRFGKYRARAIGAATAARRHPQRVLQIAERTRAELDGTADFAVGDGVADADVHVGRQAK
jgi:hypothetical protein